jgi:hypothetical protein
MLLERYGRAVLNLTRWLPWQRNESSLVQQKAKQPDEFVLRWLLFASSDQSRYGKSGRSTGRDGGTASALRCKGGGGELGKPTDRQGIALNWPPARVCMCVSTHKWLKYSCLNTRTWKLLVRSSCALALHSEDLYEAWQKAPRIINFGTRRRWVVSFTLRSQVRVSAGT